MRLIVVFAIACSSSGEAPNDKAIDKPADKTVDKPIDKPAPAQPPDAAAASPLDAGEPDAPAPPPDAAKPEAKQPAAKPAGSGSGEVQRGFPAEVIRKIVMANVDKIRACYTDELAKRPGLDGTIGVTFVVGEDGSVIRSTTPIGDAAVGTCINAVIQKAKFPKPPGGGTVTINYPFVFEASE